VNFASKAFFIFLLVVLLVYHRLPTRSHKYRFLLAASWFFYMSWNPWFIWIILFTSVVDYAAGLLIEGAPTRQRRRGWLLLSLITNLGFLAVFKYTNFFLDNSLALAHQLGWSVPDWKVQIILPLGISFHTFQGISYTMEVYRNKIPAVRGFSDFALFIAFFPQLVAGPIVRATEFLPQMVTPPRVTATQVEEGLHLFVLGLFKKVFLADRLAQFVDPVFARPELYGAATHRWAVLAYAAQIYCDFSGYSDIAIGCAKWFGFELPQNFNFPYAAENITDFWRRWHISLSRWLRDYLYIPLGGNRRGTLRTYVNLLVTMTLCGFWHGPRWNWALWGLCNGVMMSLHRAYDRALTGRGWADRVRGSMWYRLPAVAVTLLLVLFGLVLVRSESWTGCWLVERALISWGSSGAGQPWTPAWVPLLLGMVAVGHVLGGLRGRWPEPVRLPAPLRAAVYVAAVLLLVVLGPWGGMPFIYFQF
jgi:alginate O-acetyltransferase complex protein AlgI